MDPADCNPNVKFAKYYNFSSADGTLQLAVDLDGKGKKAMPGPCITCHGGRGDPLTPADAVSGKPRFPLVENSLSRKRGDTEARLQGMNVDSFEFSKQAGWTRGDQEATCARTRVRRRGRRSPGLGSGLHARGRPRERTSGRARRRK